MLYASQPCGCNLTSLNFVNFYLRNRNQRVKINNQWAEIVFRVAQGYILSPIVFNIFLCDLFLFIKNKHVANYADDTTP